MDANDSVVELCSAGMMAEGEGRMDDARALFEQAWERRTDDFDACVAAHYVARRQTTPEDTLRWNLLSLAHADAVADERVRGFFPSLYLNVSRSHEVLGDHAEARRYYELAAARVPDLPSDGYGDWVRNGVEAARHRLA